jgi:hypothetical protein
MNRSQGSSYAFGRSNKHAALAEWQKRTANSKTKSSKRLVSKKKQVRQKGNVEGKLSKSSNGFTTKNDGCDRDCQPTNVDKSPLDCFTCTASSPDEDYVSDYVTVCDSIDNTSLVLLDQHLGKLQRSPIVNSKLIFDEYFESDSFLESFQTPDIEFQENHTDSNMNSDETFVQSLLSLSFDSMSLSDDEIFRYENQDNRKSKTITEDSYPQPKPKDFPKISNKAHFDPIVRHSDDSPYVQQNLKRKRDAGEKVENAVVGPDSKQMKAINQMMTYLHNNRDENVEYPIFLFEFKLIVEQCTELHLNGLREYRHLPGSIFDKVVAKIGGDEFLKIYLASKSYDKNQTKLPTIL